MFRTQGPRLSSGSDQPRSAIHAHGLASLPELFPAATCAEVVLRGADGSERAYHQSRKPPVLHRRRRGKQFPISMWRVVKHSFQTFLIALDSSSSAGIVSDRLSPDGLSETLLAPGLHADPAARYDVSGAAGRSGERAPPEDYLAFQTSAQGAASAAGAGAGARGTLMGSLELARRRALDSVYRSIARFADGSGGA